jgi:hypothetical protein
MTAEVSVLIGKTAAFAPLGRSAAELEDDGEALNAAGRAKR